MMTASAIYSARVVARKPAGLIKKIFSEIKRWHRNYHTRKQMTEIPVHLLDDLGLTKEQVYHETRRPFWD
ncbi:DUF1127 domain-containing protein [Vibrio penaeicida]|uniref:DUF1127 domain-containing protein n=1 Tax=Vibrio penaeicida TaxID=104609 RepID=UPI003529DB69